MDHSPLHYPGAARLQHSGMISSPLVKTPGRLGRNNGNFTYSLNYTPKFKTPGKSIMGHLTHSPRYQSPCQATPVRRTPTPGSLVMNPFESTTLDRLHQNTFSPGVFAHMSTPSSEGKSPKPFRWSIDQVAILHPADIEEMPYQQDTLSIINDQETEEHAQKAIDTFFSTQLIVPSPWQSESSKSRIKNKSTDELSADTSGVFNDGEQHKKMGKTCEVACQTSLSIPLDFDLQKVLGEYFLSNAMEDSARDSLSSSGLRRKLFFHGGAQESISPVKSNSHTEGVQPNPSSPRLSPLSSQTPDNKRSPLLTPGSSQFSSSPIVLHKGSGENIKYGRCSLEPEHMASPELSPIGCTMPSTPSVFPLQATPSSGRASIPAGSPGVSPIFERRELIGSGKTSPVQALTFDDCENDEIENQSPLPSPNTFLSGEDSQGFNFDKPAFKNQILQNHETSNNSQCMDVDMTCIDQNSEKSGLHFGGKISALQDMDMECSTVPNITNLESRYQTSSMQQINSTNQDTGYQTCSLQHTNLTNHDFGSISQQKGSSNHELGTFPLISSKPVDNVADFSCLKETVISDNVENVIPSHGNENQFQISKDQKPLYTDIYNPKKDVKTFTTAFSAQNMMMTNANQNLPICSQDDLIIRRARQVLGKTNDSGFSYNSLLDTSTNTSHSSILKQYLPDMNTSHTKRVPLSSIAPRIFNATGVPLFPWQPIGFSTPQKGHLGKTSSFSTDTDPAHISSTLASMKAMEVLKRAEEDYAKYCGQTNH